MTPPPLGLKDAVLVASSIAALGPLWDAAELASQRGRLVSFFRWSAVGPVHPLLAGRPRLASRLGAALGDRRLAVLVALHAVAALAFPFLLLRSGPAAAAAAAFVVLGRTAMRLRFLVGMEGADKMQSILWIGFFVYGLGLSETADHLACGFIAAQSVLSYVTAGVAKVLTASWRNGTAVGRAAASLSYSTPSFARALGRPAASALLTWGTLAFELGGPFLLLTGRAGGLGFVLMAAAFHMGVAVVLGLVTFLFAFAAALPLVYYFATLVRL